MHLAMKPFVKIAAYGVILPLTVAGYIDLVFGLFFIITAGLLSRTAYTTYRFVDAAARGREKPWLALIVGVFPVIGNTAYPVQIIYSGTERDAKLAQFIVYDTMTLMGDKMPIWGGPDTQTEHWFNRLGDWVVRDRSSLEEHLQATESNQPEAEQPEPAETAEPTDPTDPTEPAPAQAV